ncbi:Nitrous-oxide reductase [Rhodothermus marinus SG0.5JP17-172]|jgi:nitrous-oxide reductase|uniref:Sec-dependent nitrous-oxide reductase n=1 Tax=Rhodothermus marinus TaxID=29549 RepID=UPI000223D730|nr:Sec-dependent nitrous-oxide reductase [Rhodothermus marinus]AEN72785.1 Nitrous-oxide reductase [Rhodothermus marinus SG0.5JP17-172]MBO2490547.1 Sec-dependent nitrous-oxide reductase [Rhodothermus marinus]
MKRHTLRGLTGLALAALLIGLIGCRGGGQTGAVVSEDPVEIARARGLSPADVVAAVKTYQPTGTYDEYIMFASGGHSGQVLVIGIPSMRLLKVIGVFTPEPWQGWGFSKETREVLAQGNYDGKELTWGDVHHPALSETNGDYDGQFLFVNEKANARVAVIDLRDFETKQIVKNPLSLSDHGGTFVTPNTEWVIEGGQYAAPFEGYASLDQYKEKYRGLVTFWKFDRERGRILPEQSFALELPPYWQDLCDAGKQVSEGWVFCNSFNTEMATGGVEKGNPPFEAGASQRDMDYLHVINLRKAAELVEAGRTRTIKGFKVLPLDVAAAEGVLYFIPEPKSPHGVDVSPDGNYLVVSGKLDPHATIYNFQKIQDAIANERFSGRDDYGVPILDFDAVVEAQVELGLGPLHTQFDPNGYAYTSLFLESAVVRWTLGGPWAEKHGRDPWTVVDKVSVHYNIGHLAVAEGDNVNPDGRYLVAMNKWSVDRFANVGPLLPQNFQLIDIGNPNGPMQLLYDMPIALGEPHYAQIIKADKLHPWEVYPEVGWDPTTQSRHPAATRPGEERIERRGNTVEIWMTATRSHFTPEHVEVRKGDRVIWHITNIERARDATHGFALPGYNFNLSIEPGETATIEFVADRDGVFAFYCTEFCSALHLEMAGYFLVRP